MNKCENCIHYDACKKISDVHGLAFGSSPFCDHYKDKSLFVELPCRCKDCKNFISKDNSISYDGKCLVYMRYVEKDDFCKYAEPKESCVRWGDE